MVILRKAWKYYDINTKMYKTTMKIKKFFELLIVIISYMCLGC